jgi:hypothetical protein
MAAAVEKLSAEMAAKAHVAALSRDYVCEPHIGRAAQYLDGLGHNPLSIIFR